MKEELHIYIWNKNNKEYFSDIHELLSIWSFIRAFSKAKIEKTKIVLHQHDLTKICIIYEIYIGVFHLHLSFSSSFTFPIKFISSFICNKPKDVNETHHFMQQKLVISIVIFSENSSARDMPLQKIFQPIMQQLQP